MTSNDPPDRSLECLLDEYLRISAQHALMRIIARPEAVDSVDEWFDAAKRELVAEAKRSHRQQRPGEDDVA